MKKKIMEIFVHFIYNVVQIKEHIDQYFHTYFIRFELNKYLFFKFTSHTCTSVCAEPRVFVKPNSLWDWIVISACIFVKRWILGLQNVHAYIETENRIHLYLHVVRGWGVACKPKHFIFYVLRFMENLIKIIVNWVTFTCTLAIHLWLSYIPTFTFGFSPVRLFGTLHSYLKGFSY